MVDSHQQTPNRLQIAFALAEQGYSLIPVDRNKKPRIKWTNGQKNYQQERATPDEIRQWWKRWPDTNFAIVTGAVSGIFAAETDDRAALRIMRERGLPLTFTVRS